MNRLAAALFAVFLALPSAAQDPDPPLPDTLGHWFKTKSFFDLANRCVYFDLNENQRQDAGELCQGDAGSSHAATADFATEAGALTNIPAGSQVCFNGVFGWMIDADASNCATFDPLADQLLGSNVGFAYAAHFLSGSETCGVQEAINAIAALGGGIVYVPPTAICDRISKPLHLNTNVSLIGVGPGHHLWPAAGHTGSGLRPASDWAYQVTGTSDTLTLDLDSVSAATIHVCDGGSGCSGACPAYSASALESTLVHLGGGNASSGDTAGSFVSFEVGQYVRLDQFDSGGAQGSLGHDSGGPYEILEQLDSCQGGTNPGARCPLGTECTGGGTCRAAATVRVRDPKNRLANTACGDGNERVHGLVAEFTAGVGDVGDLDPIDVTGDAGGDVPFILRFKTAGARTCPFGANCFRNWRRWPIIAKMSATKLALDDPNEFAISQAGVGVDWVASPPLIFRGESYHGGASEFGRQVRGASLEGMSFIGDADGDGDGDVAHGLWEQADADHSNTYSLLRRSNVNWTTFGNGDATFGGEDWSVLDGAYVNQGVQGNDTGATSTNDQNDQQIVKNEHIWDVGTGWFINSKQAVAMKFESVGVADASYADMELEAGQVQIEDYLATHLSAAQGIPDEVDYNFLVRTASASAPELTVRNCRVESGAGTFLRVDGGKAVPVVLDACRIQLQRQDRDTCIDYQGTGKLSLRDMIFQVDDNSWNCNIEAPNATKIVQLGESQIGAGGAASTTVIGDRNYGVLPEGTATTFAASWLAPDASSDIPLAGPMRPITLHRAYCIAVGAGTTFTCTPQECEADLTGCTDIEAAITCDDDGTEVLAADLDDVRIAAGKMIRFDAGAGTGSPTAGMCALYGY